MNNNPHYFSGIKHILDVPIKVAKEIYLSDSWFVENAGYNKERYLNFRVEGDGITNVTASRESQDGYTKIIGSTQNKELLEKFDNNEFLKMIFSVKGNKGPYEYFKANSVYINNNNTNENLAFFAHIAYLNKAWDANNDTVFNFLFGKIGKKKEIDKDSFLELIKDKDLKTLMENEDIQEYKTEYITLLNNLLTNPEIQNKQLDKDKKKIIEDGLQNDMAKGQLYSSNLNKNHVGGMKHKKNKSKKHKSKTANKSKKNKKKTKKHK